ncbi:formylglycine-generating enzyme family protein [Pseudomonas sp. BN411]|uniref:formylglycine-generating enzyme family protein n=1 Tax=Pseudomonas sp. BN411 TaxID=2567887 RepID=UPI002458329C|nr:formylglycine-generating enzyme family protein [Pseudomonas sp. BN411]MDH4559921.1 formylglycine-generating enzyme family protein [Pseudomonas sp. BN411]
MRRGLIAAGCLGVLALAGIVARTGATPPLGNVAGCEAYAGLPAGSDDDPLAGMVRISGGRFTPGTEGGYPDERPFGAVEVGDFWIDRTEVTRAQFAAFVESTGYITEAERSGGAAMFRAPLETAGDGSALPWWRYVEGANWRHPEGPEGPEVKLDQYPVTLVTLADAQAYAQWRGNQLPGEAEWEYAARGADASQRLGEEPLDSHGRPAANYWQGVFPVQDAAEDGFAGLAPVGCFAANAQGLFDMIGNVWEWTADAQWGPLISHANGDPGQLRAALGPSRPRIIKGGSYLCATSYCARYRAAARERQEADLATSHVGFRTIRRIAPESTLATE